jgi:alpha-L-rhamnosidase
MALADRYLSRLGPWQEMIRNGMTTTAETPEPTRSDSHAWAAHPNYQLLATVLGIRPAAPGFKRVAITPALGNLKFAEGQMPHPAGEIRVFYRMQKDTLFADVILPPAVSGDFVWRSARFDLKGGINSIVCTADQCRPADAENLRPVADKGE